MILDVCGQIVKRGYGLGNDVSVSCRLTRNEYLITAIGVNLRHLTEEDVVMIDRDGKLSERNKYFTPSPDYPLHMEAYDNNPMALGACIAQPPYATAHAVTYEPVDLPLMAKTVSNLGKVPVAGYAAPESPEAAEAVRPYLRDGSAAVLLGNRGALTWGSNLFEAYQRMEDLELYAMIDTITGGKARPIPDGELDKLLELRSRYNFIPAGGDPHTRISKQ